MEENLNVFLKKKEEYREILVYNQKYITCHYLINWIFTKASIENLLLQLTGLQLDAGK